MNIHFHPNKPGKLQGRVKRIRTLSKHLGFFNIEDVEMSFQIGVRDTSLLPGPFDIVEVEGIYNPSETGEETLWADRIKILSKCEGTLPSYRGIKDGKLSVERRYLQLITDRDLSRNLHGRAKLIRGLREFLWSREFEEIETPILSSVPSGATATPFITKSNSLNTDFYLRIATETALKKAIVAGYRNVFEIGRIFRNEGIDKTHNPEFTSIELYSAYNELSYCRTLLTAFLDKYMVIPDYHTFEYDDLVKQYGPDFDQHLIQPTFVYGHPADDAPLCALRPDGKCNRFEFFMGGMEIANAYQELTDWRLQKDRLKGANDDGLVDALTYGCPPMTGMGIGLDRLVMIMFGVGDIKDSIMFPTKRNE